MLGDHPIDVVETSPLRARVLVRNRRAELAAHG